MLIPRSCRAIDCSMNTRQNDFMYKQIFNRISFVLFNFLVIFSFSSLSHAQADNSKNPYPHIYQNQIDNELSFKTITLAPAYDNVNGIYKSVADKKIKDLIADDHFWSESEFQQADSRSEKKIRFDWFEDQPEYTRNTILNSKADALITTVITKSNTGLSVTLNLFTKSGLLLLTVNQKDEKAFEISKLNEIIEKLYLNLKQKLPYSGFVASRKGNTVTVNLGKNSGLKINDKLSVAQIISIKRHPKLQFMTGIEKEIIGQIIISKVDSELSFGQISFEKESGVIQKNSKILPAGFTKYELQGLDQPILTNDQQAKEWLPEANAQYGKVSAAVGITDYKISAIDRAGGNSYALSQNFSPTLKFGLELWITSEWFAGLEMKQSFFKATNGLSGSQPDTLSFTLSKYDFIYGYKYAMTGDYYGPQVNIGFGYLSHKTQVTDSSPVALTSTESKGWLLQLGGYFPISDDNKTGLGAKTKFILFSQLTESPVNSGNASPSMTSLNLYLTHQISQNVQIKPEIDYGSINTNFSGTGTNLNSLRSSEEKIMSYLLGIEYLF